MCYSYLPLYKMGPSISIAFAVMSLAFVYLTLINWGIYIPTQICYQSMPTFAKKQLKIIIQIYWNKELLSALLHNCSYSHTISKETFVGIQEI